MKGVDYGFGKVRGVIIRSYGYGFVCRYLSLNPSKTINSNEIQDFRDNKLQIVLVWETTTLRPLEGKAAGKIDAETALDELKKLNLPADSVIYFAADSDFNDAQCELIANYFDGVASVLDTSRIGIYGGLKVVKYAFDTKLVSYGWQTYAWSHGKWDERAQLRQTDIYGPKLDGVNCDTNESMQDDFGQIK